MMKKLGVNTTRIEKSGPNVKKGVVSPEGRFCRTVTCPNCGAKLEKSCSSEAVCEIATVRCPKCGASIT